MSDFESMLIPSSKGGVLSPISKGGIRFISPNLLKGMITFIETKFPGYRWSISQQAGQIVVSIAPTPDSLHKYDVLFSQTDQGDKGFIKVIPLTSNKDLFKIPLTLSHLLTAIAILRKPFEERILKMSIEEVAVIKNNENYRHQSEDDLKLLCNDYSVFLKDIYDLEKKDVPYTVEELYLGSCQLSVDCSIRGKKLDGSEFDISVDYQDDAKLYLSLLDAHLNFRGEVLGI